MRFVVFLGLFLGLSASLNAEPLTPIKYKDGLIFDTVVATSDAKRYTSGWLQLFDKPTTYESYSIGAHGDAGCKLNVESPVHVFDGAKLSISNVSPEGKIAYEGPITHIKFNYSNSGQAKFCRVRITVDGANGENSKKEGQLTVLEKAKKAEGSMLLMSSRMNLLEAQKKVDYSSIESEKRKLLNELTAFVEFASETKSPKALKARFLDVVEAALEFKEEFVPVHQKQGEPAKVELHWKQFQKDFFELVGDLM